MYRSSSPALQDVDCHVSLQRPPSPPSHDGHTKSSLSDLASLSAAPRTPPRTPPFLGLGSLPYEAFIGALVFLGPIDLRSVTHVSRAWRCAALGEPRLWRCLRISLDDPHTLEKTGAWLRRAAGGLRELCFTLPDSAGTGVRVDLDIVCRRLEAVVVQLAQTDGGRALRKLSLRLLDGGDLDALRLLFAALRCFMHERVFDCVVELEIQTALCVVELPDTFLSTFGQLERLTFVCEPLDDPDIRDESGLPWHWLDAGPVTLAQSSLRSLCIHGPIFFNDFHVPSFPHLETLELSDFRMTGSVLYAFLRNAPNLVRLSVVNFVKADDDDELDEEAMASVASLTRPEPIRLSNLVHLLCAGEDTPAFWASNDELAWPPAPEIHMPALVEATLRSLQSVEVDLMARDDDDDGGNDDEGDENSSATVAATDALQALCMRSPCIRTLSLDFCAISDNGLFEALGLACHLSILSLQGTDVTDHIIRVLPGLCPHLSELDVRKCRGVSARAVARCVELVRDGSGGFQRVRRVQMDEPRLVEEATSEWDYWNWQAWDWLRWIGVLEEQPLPLERRMAKCSRARFLDYISHWRQTQALQRQAQLQAAQQLHAQRQVQALARAGIAVG
jgi:hypothetical protein